MGWSLGITFIFFIFKIKILNFLLINRDLKHLLVNFFNNFMNILKFKPLNKFNFKYKKNLYLILNLKNICIKFL